MSPELQDRIEDRVAQLRLLGAWTALRFHRDIVIPRWKLPGAPDRPVPPWVVEGDGFPPR
jgi:hypothetical protein